MFSYHLKDTPSGGNDIAPPELNEPTAMITIGARMNMNVITVAILHSRFTLSSRIFSTSQSSIYAVAETVGYYLEHKDREHKYVADGVGELKVVGRLYLVVNERCHR